MKKYFFILFIIIFNIGCFGRVNSDKIIIDNAKHVTYKDFFNHMTSNKWPEKIHTKNYKIFNTNDEKFVYYGKPIRNKKNLEIYKIDKNQLESKFPIYQKIDGLKLMEIIKKDYQEKNNLDYRKVRYHDSEYNLNEDIIECKVKFYINKGKQNNEVISELEEVSYELSSKDFYIIKRN